MEIQRKISHKIFVGKKNEEISENYEIERVLGEGAFAVVYLAKRKN